MQYDLSYLPSEKLPRYIYVASRIAYARSNGKGSHDQEHITIETQDGRHVVPAWFSKNSELEASLKFGGDDILTKQIASDKAVLDVMENSQVTDIVFGLQEDDLCELANGELLISELPPSQILRLDEYTSVSHVIANKLGIPAEQRQQWRGKCRELLQDERGLLMIETCLSAAKQMWADNGAAAKQMWADNKAAAEERAAAQMRLAVDEAAAEVAKWLADNGVALEERIAGDEEQQRDEFSVTVPSNVKCPEGMNILWVSALADVIKPPESCPKCDEKTWKVLAVSPSKKSIKYECMWCKKIALQSLESDSGSSDESSNAARSRSIPQNVKRAVWKRDEGKCVECGSKEKLEYDHIIPFSKGGSNTERNIQLLCEPCNRKKSDNL